MIALYAYKEFLNGKFRPLSSLFERMHMVSEPGLKYVVAKSVRNPISKNLYFLICIS